METIKRPKRLLSLDALRGFDMFWIIGGEGIFHTLSNYTNMPFWNSLSKQFEHVEWNGFVAYDLIFPLFLFIAGVAMPYSLTQRVERGDDIGKLQYHVVKRGLTLVLFGLIYNHLFDLDFQNMRYPSVLGRIGLAYMFAGLIVLNTKLRGQVIWFVSILTGYWLALRFVPVPGFSAGDYSVEGNLVGYIDRLILPGQLYLKVFDPEGLFSTVPAISTALLGAFAGYLLRSDEYKFTMLKKGYLIGVAGLICLVLGHVWGLGFPVNKNLWTSSFVLVAGGWSLLLLSLFYLIIDVWGFTSWTFSFVLIGMNSITMYMLQKGIIDFDKATSFFFDGATSQFDEGIQPVLYIFCLLFVKLVFLYILYRNKIFLRV